jgi:tripartite-type tricarboxylate transporter receptor subunit TctC
MGDAFAQYPSRSITVIVPFSAGGPTDVLVRTLGDRMRVSLGQQVVIENVTGAGGSIGVGRAARAPADGYTLSIGHLGTHVVNGAIYPLQYDLLNDLEPVALLTSNPMMLVTKNAVAAKDLNELIAWLKANDGTVTAGTAGVGSGSHFSGVYLQNLIGAKFQFVPYRGTGPALQDLVAGQIDMMITSTTDVIPQVRAGTIKAFAVSTDRRVAALPEIPTVDEAGLPGYHTQMWHALWAPAGTPMEVIAKLNAAAVEALADPAVRKRLADIDQDIPPRERQTPAALGAHHMAEIEKWWPVIKAAEIKPE